MKRGDSYLPAALTGLFFISALIVSSFHELWIDEAYHYLLARDSRSLRELIANGASTGHPVLWNILLFLLKPWLSIVTMQLLHCVCATATVWMLCMYSPFGKTELILMIFGYYFFFEYTVIAKNYAPGFALVFLAIVLHEKQQRRIWIALALGLAGNMHLFTLLVSLSLYLYTRSARRVRYYSEALIADGVFLILLTVALVQIIPPASIIQSYQDHDVGELISADRLGRSLGVAARGLLNVPHFSRPAYWNSNYLFHISNLLGYLLSGALLAFILYHFRNNRKLLALYFVPIGLIMVFVYLAPLAHGVRYWGYAYLMMIICCQLAFSEITPAFRRFFRAVLLLQFLVCLPVVFLEVRRPFSNARAASEKIERQNYSHLSLFVQGVTQGPSLSAYQAKPVFFPSSGAFCSFAFYKYHTTESQVDFLRSAIDHFSRQSLDSCLVVLKKPLEYPAIYTLPKGYNLTFFSADSGAVVVSENYFIYLLCERP